MKKIFEKSVLEAAYSIRRTGYHIPAPLIPVMARAFEMIPNMLPVSPMCVADVRVDRNLDTMKNYFVLRVLVQLGWDMPTSMLLWRNFRLNFPGDPLHFDAKRLLSRAQLVEQYGKTYGDMLADVISSPAHQPILNVLLSGDWDGMQSHPLYYALGLFSASYPEDLEYDRPTDVRLSDTTWKWSGGSDQPQVLGVSEAESIYARATRKEGTLQHSFVLDPKFIDFAAEADRAENR